jgi:hypothetical protein
MLSRDQWESGAELDLWFCLIYNEGVICLVFLSDFEKTRKKEFFDVSAIAASVP